MSDDPEADRDNVVAMPVPSEVIDSFEFARDDEFTIHDAVAQAVGAASMCWQYPEAAGTFDSDRAIEIVVALCAEIEDHVAAMIVASQLPIDPGA